MERIAMSQEERDELNWLQRARDGSITQREAAERIGVSERWVRKQIRRMAKRGDAVVVHGLRGRPSNHRVSAATQRQALAILKQPEWHDFGPTFAAEQLGKRHQIHVGKETLRGWMIEAGMWKSQAQGRPEVHGWRRLVVSTSEVRTRIEGGEVSLAGRLLERPYALSGDVVPGHGVGSKQTVPTLNLHTEAPVLPHNGVYITRTTDPETGRRWNSITNIGIRPTFGGDKLTIETFLLDAFDGATPSRIRVEFLRRVRDERKFESPEALKSQILRDVGRAQAYFRRLARWVI